MRTALAAAALALLAACRGGVRDPRAGTIELVFELVQRASAPDVGPLVAPVRELVARRLAELRIPVEVAREGGHLVVAVRGDSEPALIGRVKAAVLTQGRLEFRGFDGDALGPIVVDNGAIRDARSTSEGEPGIAVSLRPDAAERFEAATRRLVGSRLVITLDGRLIGAPLVEAPISGDRIRLTLGTRATRDLAETIALVLRAGEPLPVPLRLVEQRRVPPRTG